MSNFSVGDLVLCDNKEYRIIGFGPRNELDPLPGVNLIGNMALLSRPDEVEFWAYEWELEPVTYIANLGN